MPDDSSELIGQVAVGISGDYSQLQADFQTSQTLAQTAGQAIASGLEAGAAGSEKLTDATDILAAKIQELVTSGMSVNEAMATATASMSEASGAASEAAGGVSGLAEATEAAGAAGNAASGGMAEASGSEKELGDAAREAESEVSNLGEGLGGVGEKAIELVGMLGVGFGLGEIGKEALGAYAGVERASEALTAMTGSAKQTEETLSRLKSLAISDALAFPSLLQATQRMTNFGFTTEQIPRVLQAAADASRAAGISFDEVAHSIGNIALAGMVMPRTLVRIGLSAQDLANVMGVSAADVSKAFKGMEEGMRVETITAALQKHKGLAEATAKDLQGTWDNFKNYLHFTFEEIGKDLEGPAKGFLALGAQAAQGIGGIVENLSKLSSVLPESVAGINSLGTAISILVSFYSPTYGLATALFLAATAAQSARAATEEGEAAGRTYEQTLQRQAVALEKSAGSNTELRHRIEDLQEAYSYGKITQDAFAKGLAEISIGIGQAVPRAATAVEDIRAKIRAAAQAALEGTKAYSDYTASMAKLDAMMDKARLMPSGATAGLGVFDQFPALSQQITDDLKRISDAAVAAENATGAVGKNIIDTLTGITPALQAPTVALMNHDELLKRIDVDSTSSLRAEADALGQVYERLVAMNAAGKATDQEVVAGFKAWEDAAKKADGTTGQLQERSKSAGLELGRTFNSATRDIADLITGTGSLDAVLKRLGTDLLHQGLSMALAPIKANLQGMFSGGVGGASAGAQEAAMAALNAAVVANTVATTTTGTVQTAAETANTAALMANTAAVIQQAMSSIGSVLGLAGFQEGGVVPHDMVARLHGGEMVLPPDISGPLRGSLAGGGSIGGGGAAVHFENCSFTGVTKSLVDDIWNSAVKGARRVGAKW